jgi:hypothetical protein
MRRELLDFTENDFFKKIIYNKGTSFVSGKTMFFFLYLLLTISFLLFRCPSLINHSKPHDESLLFFFLIFILITGIYFVKRFSTPLIKQKNARTWKKTMAKIIELGIYKIRIAGYPHSTIAYFPAIMYEFNVNNTKYKNNNISFEADYTYNRELNSWSSNQYNENNKQFSKWIEKQEVEIFYNPNNPNESVVFREFTTSKKLFYTFMFTLSIITLLITLINLGCLIYSII